MSHKEKGKVRLLRHRPGDVDTWSSTLPSHRPAKLYYNYSAFFLASISDLSPPLRFFFFFLFLVE